MAATTMIHVRIDERIKAQAAETLAEMGLSVSDAVRVFLTRVVAEKQLPFALKVPNAETRAAMEEARTMAHARFATAQDLLGDIDNPAGWPDCTAKPGRLGCVFATQHFPDDAIVDKSKSLMGFPSWVVWARRVGLSQPTQPTFAQPG